MRNGIIVLVTAVTALTLAGCQTDNNTIASLQPSRSIIWARKDGQRMSGDAALLQQGVRDKGLCEVEASKLGALDFNFFSLCMDKRGYYRRDGYTTLNPSASAQQQAANAQQTLAAIALMQSMQRPVYQMPIYQPPVYQAPTYRMLNTNCNVLGNSVNCQTY